MERFDQWKIVGDCSAIVMFFRVWCNFGTFWREFCKLDWSVDRQTQAHMLH